MTRDRSPEMDAFVAEAKAVRVEQAFERCGFNLSRLRRTGAEYVGPCPACGGKDRFSIAPAKGVFNCRGAGGGDAIALAQHLTGQEFLDACEILTGQERPDRAEGDERERAARRRAAEARIAEQRREAAAADAKREAGENEYRAREVARCRETFADSFRLGDDQHDAARRYLAARGLDISAVDPAFLRTHPRLGFFHKPERGPSRLIHTGPAMVAPFLTPDNGQWRMIGLHRTWIDLDAAPKFRPALRDPETGEPLATKKMQGSKAGGLIPVIGRLGTATRMVAGEGIETALGFAAFDGHRADTFYCAAGDLGNLCGKALASSRIRHPTLRRTISGGATRPVMVPGFEPDPDAICLPVPDHIEELVLLGDGDSEVVMTRAALRRGVARHAREGRTVRSMFAPAGSDWGEYKPSRELETA